MGASAPIGESMEHQKSLQYLGKKTPCHVNIPLCKIDEKFGKEPVWVEASKADWLVKTNPCMFLVMGERGGDVDPVEDASEIIAKKIDEVKEQRRDEDLICEECGKGYKNRGRGPEFYEEHIKTCGKDDE